MNWTEVAGNTVAGGDPGRSMALALGTPRLPPGQTLVQDPVEVATRRRVPVRPDPPMGRNAGALPRCGHGEDGPSRTGQKEPVVPLTSLTTWVVELMHT